MLIYVFILGMVLIPFNDIAGIGSLGEVQHESSLYVFLIALALLCIKSFSHGEQNKALRDLLTDSASRRIFRIALVFAVLIFASFLFHSASIWSDVFRDRWAFGKFLSSSMVAFYGFGLALMTCALAGLRDWRTLIARPVAISLYLCAFFGLIEAAAYLAGGPFEVIQSGFATLVHSWQVSIGQAFIQDSWQSGSGFRLSSVCFEPPYLSAFTAFALPWVYAGYKGSEGSNRLFFLGAIWLDLILAIAANSRTGFLLFGGYAVTLAFMRLGFFMIGGRQALQMTGLFRALEIVLALVLLAGVFLASDIGDWLVANGFLGAQGTASNTSRLASNIAAFKIFGDNPLLGVGFGQYGFHASRYIPSWGWGSFEIKAWFTDSNEAWPPVFSVYARLAAELGIGGLIFWIGLWTGLARKVWRSMLSFGSTVPMPILGYPLIMSFVAVMLAGFSLDTLRMPFIWISLGLGCRFLQAVSDRPAADA